MTRALVLDAALRQSLAAVRALGRAGWDVGTGGAARVDLAASSRYARRDHRLPPADGPAPAYAAALREVLAAERYDVLLATDDATLARLASLGVGVASVPGFGPGFDRLVDKERLAEVCAAARVAYPATVPLSEPGALAAAVGEFGLPLVVKGARSALATAEAVHQAKGAVLADDAEAAARAADAVAARGVPPIAQACVAGSEKLNAMVIRARGRSRLRYAHRVLREVPSRGGIGIALETVRPDTGSGFEALDVLERVCDAAGYEGLAQAELLRAPGGELVLIEVNPRLWGSTWFAERLGLRVSEEAVAHALGRPAGGVRTYRLGRRFHHVPGELRWLAEHRGTPRALRAVLGSARPWDVWEYQDARDALALPRYAVRRLAARLTG